MVIYDLSCAVGHAFEGWFDSPEQYRAQLEAGELSCPVCGTEQIEKRPHASALGSQERRGEPQTYPVLPQVVREVMRDALREIASVVRANSEDVGDRFADEARAIHREEAPARSIRGAASAEDERALREEGVPFVKIPVPDYDA
jgi:hypothetical protein